MKVFDLQHWTDCESAYDAHFTSDKLFISEAAANEALANAVSAYEQYWLASAAKEQPDSISHKACLRYASEAARL